MWPGLNVLSSDQCHKLGWGEKVGIILGMSGLGQYWLQASNSRVSEVEVKEHTKQEQVHSKCFICCHCWCCNLAKSFSLQWWWWLRVVGRGLWVQGKLMRRTWAVKEKGGGASRKSPVKYTEYQFIALLLHHYSAKCLCDQCSNTVCQQRNNRKVWSHFPSTGQVVELDCA